jgi:peptidase M28-like protein
LVDLRIYRASLVVAVLAVVVVMFSLQERPRPLSAPIAPDAFRGDTAWSEGKRLVERFPERRPGSSDDAALGNLVESRFKSLGLEASRDRFKAEWDGEDTSMSNVIGVLSANSDRQILVVSHRDAGGRPGASSAMGTAALLELASALDGSSRQKTFVLLSTDGAAADAAGARRLAEIYPNPEKVDAVLVLDDLAASSTKRPFVVPWSDDSRRGSAQVLRTAEAALTREAAVSVGSESAAGQFVRQAWPLTLREQGPLVAAGMDAVTMTGHGELAPEPAGDTLDRTSQDRLGSFGRAAFAAALALDAAPSVEESPGRYIVTGSHIVPGWAFTLLALGFALPALVTALDAFARGLRRRDDMGGWTRWVLAGSIPFALTLAVTWLLQVVDALPSSISEALSPSSAPDFGDVGIALGALLATLVLGWRYLRPAVMGPAARRLDSPAASAEVALALLISLEALAVCITNPFTALLLVPAAHLCLLAAAPRTPSRPLLIGATTIGGLALPALAVLYYGVQLDLGLDPSAYALMVLTAGTGSLGGAILASLVAGSLASTVAVALAREAPEPDMPITVRGPASYAGPGSLGGTRSALRR